MGADYVFMGRSVLFAMAAAGEAGLAKIWSVLEDETSITLAQIGQTRMPGPSSNVMCE